MDETVDVHACDDEEEDMIDDSGTTLKGSKNAETVLRGPWLTYPSRHACDEIKVPPEGRWMSRHRKAWKSQDKEKLPIGALNPFRK